MWPFTRKPKPLNPGPINEDWRVGDLAECIADDWRSDLDLSPSRCPPVKGDVYCIETIGSRSSVHFGDTWVLGLKGLPNSYGAAGFRKVPPLNTAATAEFSESIKALRPKKVRT